MEIKFKVAHGSNEGVLKWKSQYVQKMLSNIAIACYSFVFPQ